MLSLKSEEIKGFGSKGEKELYLLKIKEVFSLSEAIKFGQEQILPIIEKSDLCIFIFPVDTYLFDVEIGPFDNKRDAEFIKEVLLNAVPVIEIKNFSPNFDYLGIKLAQKTYLRSTSSHSEQPLKIFTLKLKEGFFSFKDGAYGGILEIYKQNGSKIAVVNVLDIEEYLRGVVPSEMPASWNYEALCAQTVASRTFAFSRLLSARRNETFYDVCNTTRCQVYLGARTTPTTDKAIKDTTGLILTYNEYPIEAVFHSSSGGQTENNENVWQGSPRPYLRGVSSPGEEISPHFSWFKTYEVSEFLKFLNIYLKKEGRKELTSLISIEIKECGCSPRVRKVSIKDEKNEVLLNGSEIQSIFSLKSTWFNFLIYTAEDETPVPPIIRYLRRLLNTQNKILSLTYVYIYGRGWGHGIGMPQYGAYAMAKGGATYSEILSYYYQETKIKTLSAYEIKTFLTHTEKEQSGYSKLYFEPSQIKLYTDDFPTAIKLKVNSTASIYGISFTLSYDERLVNIDLESIKEGTFLKADGRNTIFLKNKTNNEIKIGIVREGRVGGVSGEGDLLYFEITGLNKGMTSIDLTEVQISDPQLNPISFEYEPLKIEIKERDRTPPKTNIVSYPDKFTNKKLIYFEWSGSDDITEKKSLFYSYRLNDEPWSLFSQETSHYFNLLSDGNYKFEVRARDEAGNIDPNPSTYEFTLDSTPPFIELSHYPTKTFEKFILLKGTTEPDSTLLINGENLQLNPDGGFTYKAELKIGENLFRFIAIDRMSNSKVLDITITREVITRTVIVLTIGSKKALVNESVLNLEVAPLIEEGRTFVPLRFIAESFGAEVLWDPPTKRIDIVLEHPLVKKKITLWLKKNTAHVNGKEITIDVPPFILPPGRTVVPIRFIAESFDSEVEWKPLVKNIIIIFPKNELIEGAHFRFREEIKK